MDESEEDERRPDILPSRKKTRKNKKKRTKKKKTSKIRQGRDNTTQDAGKEGTLTHSPSTPRGTRSYVKVTSSGKKGATRGEKPSYEKYDHINKIVVVEASIILEQDDKCTELTMALRTLFRKF